MLRIVLPIVLVLAIIVGGIYIGIMKYKDHLLDQIEYIPRVENPTFIDEEGSVVTLSHYTSETSFELVEEEHIHNFLLIGIDSRDKNYSDDGSGSLADVIMVMSVDDSAGTIKLLTIQRDCYVSIPGHKKLQKINAAMTYGGPELLSLVIENHLRVTLDGYAYVNFYNMEKVIDAVGGIDLEVTKSEVFHNPGGLNDNLRDLNRLTGDPDDKYSLSESGLQHLNGRQAVEYSRIRMVGNGIYGRSERQVKVLNELLKKYTDLSTTSKLSALDDILRMIATNISRDDIEKYAFDFLPNARNLQLQTMGIPVEGYSVEGEFDDDIRPGDWSIRCDWNGMVPLVQEFFYGETYPFDPVPEITRAPKHTQETSGDS
ncbi:MAG: LCP family protein [Clostridiales bacterium]|nr:LCP family protein [Clostridiales bacterium]